MVFGDEILGDKLNLAKRAGAPLMELFVKSDRHQPYQTSVHFIVVKDKKVEYFFNGKP